MRVRVRGQARRTRLNSDKGDSLLGLGRRLTDAEDDELSGPEDGQADQEDHTAVVEVVLRHRRAVAADEVGLLGGRALEGTAPALEAEEILDGAPELLPERLPVGLEDGPWREGLRYFSTGTYGSLPHSAQEAS